MIEELRELFANLYAAGCEHESYAYALSDALNAEVDAALLKAFKNDLNNLVMRCELVSETERYVLDQMKRHRIPKRPFVWYKLHRVPNEAAKRVHEVLWQGEEAYLRGVGMQTSQIEYEVKVAQNGFSEPEGVPLEEEPEEAANMPQDAPQAEKPEEEGGKPRKRRKASRRGEIPPRAEAKAAEQPETGNESAAELWDEEEADEDELRGDAK